MDSQHTYAIFSAQYPPHMGGVELFTERLAHELAMQGNRAIVVTSKLDASCAHELRPDGVEVYRLPCYALMGGRLPISRKNTSYRQMMDELVSQGIDRVLVNTRFYRHSLEGMCFAKRIGAPVIVLDHGSAHLTLGNAFADWFVKRYEHVVTCTGMRKAPAYAGISRASTKWVEHFGIHTQTVIPNAIDAEAFRALAANRDFKADLRVMPNQKLVTFVGRLEPEKGALAFAHMARILGDEFICVMAGDGSQRSQIEELGFSNLTLLGKVDQPTLSALLRDADVFCLPTRSEGFCTSLLEASAQGAIPVMPRVGGTDEIMGYDPVRFGVLLDNRDPAHIADAVRQAAQLEAQTLELEEYVTVRCTWGETTSALDAAFNALDS